MRISVPCRGLLPQVFAQRSTGSELHLSALRIDLHALDELRSVAKGSRKVTALLRGLPMKGDSKKTRGKLIDERDEALRRLRIVEACLDHDDVKLRAEFAGGRGMLELNERIQGLRIFTAQCRELLNDPLAVNYVECCMRDGQGELVLTVRKKEGKTPNELRLEALAECDRLRSQLAEAHERGITLGRAMERG